MTIALNTSELPKFDLAITGCVIDDPTSRADRQKAASEAYHRGIPALSVAVLQPSERLIVKSIQYAVERLLRDVMLVKAGEQLALDACIPNVHQNLLSGFSLEPRSESHFVLISPLTNAQAEIALIEKHVNSMGSRHAYEEANRLKKESIYHYKGARLSDQGMTREIPPAGGGDKIEPYEISMLRYATGRILDVGCGDGRIAVYLMRPKQKHLFKATEVIGLDTTPSALEILTARFVEENLGCPQTYFGDFISEKWDHLGKFNTILLCGNNFGIASSYDQVLELLRKAKTLAFPGCWLIGSSRHPFHPKTPASERNVSQMNIERGFGAGERWICLTYQNHDSGWVQWYYLAPQELEQAARASGWRLNFIVYEPQKGQPVETLNFEQFEADGKTDEYGVVLSLQE